MKTALLCETLAEYIRTEITDFNVKAAPEANVAPWGHYMLAHRGEVLIWADSFNYTMHEPRLENRSLTKKHHTKKQIRIVISVGERTLDRLSLLDDAIEKIEELLTNLVIQNLRAFAPVATTKLTVDENRVFWRQMYFDTVYQFKIEPHGLPEEEA